MRLALVTCLMLGAAQPAPASHRGPTVKLTTDGPKPAIVIVAPGTEVSWRNDDSVARHLAGGVSSPSIAPGGGYKRRFNRVGYYRYRYESNEALRGTVIVRAAVYRPRAGSGTGGSRVVMHRYSARLRLTALETYRFYDGRWRSTVGPCNVEIGSGSRRLDLRIDFPSVKYTRVGRTAEVLYSSSARGRLHTLAERVSARVMTGQSPIIACPGGGSDPVADKHVQCTQDRSGSVGPFKLGWAPSAESRFGLDDRSKHRGKTCGLVHAGGLGLAGIDPKALELQLLPEDFAYDLVQTSPASAAEVTALRAGQPLLIRRTLSLSYTNDCCNWWVPSGVENPYTRVGSVWNVKAKLEMRLKPRR